MKNFLKIVELAHLIEIWEYTVITQNFAKTQHCAAKNAEKHAPTEVIELSSSTDERHPAKRKSGCEIFSQNNKNQDCVIVGLLICTLISENQVLEKSRSASNLKKFSGPANLDFFFSFSPGFFFSLPPWFFSGLWYKYSFF